MLLPSPSGVRLFHSLFFCAIQNHLESITTKFHLLHCLPSQISFTGVLGVALMLGAALDHARASSLDAGEPGSDFFLALLGG